MKQRAIPAVTFVVISLVMISKSAIGQGSVKDYERSASYGQRTNHLVFRDSIEPNWFGAEMDRMWYRIRTGRQSHEFVIVDCSSGKRKLAFDHGKLAKDLSQRLDRQIDADRLELKSLIFADDLTSCRFIVSGKSFRYEIISGKLTPFDPVHESVSRSGVKPRDRIVRSRGGQDRAPIRFENRTDQTLEVFWVPGNGPHVSYGKVRAGKSLHSASYVGHAWVLKTEEGESVAAFVVDPFVEIAIIDDDTPKPIAPRRQQQTSRNAKVSPNGRWRAVTDGSRFKVVNVETDETVVSSDTDYDNLRYGGRVWWSPDSNHFIIMQIEPGQDRKIPMVESSPANSIHSKLVTISYAKPGDDIDKPKPLLVRISPPSIHSIDTELFENPFSLKDLQWSRSGDSFSFLYNQRGHQTLRVVSVDANTKTARTVVEDVSDTFVCYSSKSYLHRINDEELIWMSERSGWNHLYLIDQTTGQVKNAITSGRWVVRRVERVDDQQRQIWLTVSGIDPDQDPYHRHLIRVNFDGTGLVRLTEGDGDHTWQFSPDNQYLIDTYSRVDMPPKSLVRHAVTGERVCDLEQADTSALLTTGWRTPERFVAKGRDGKTDIWGIIIRPTNFDPEKSYPVLEAIYAGPHGAFVPKTFGRHRGLYEMAELGFVVVKIDGMGTNHRSKAFHDVCWKNLGDSGFPDRIAWIKAAAKDRPEMDLSRVGIWGGSAGGQSAMRALIAHGDFYHAAVADCGCHDNRVDKIWWNEQWMGWPIGPHYAEQSNVTQAHRIEGDLMLIWGELDHNVDPASTMQVINALVKADKDFEQLIMPGVGHGAAGRPYAKRRQADFFIRSLWNREPRSTKH